MPKKILICEDDEGIKEILSTILIDKGYEVMALLDGRGIQKKVKQFCPDLILLDIWLPGIDGREIIKLLKRDSKTKNIPIVVVSALNESEIERIVKQTSADDYITKPFDLMELIQKVEKFTKLR